MDLEKIGNEVGAEIIGIATQDRSANPDDFGGTVAAINEFAASAE
jgi:hypothetical protein